MIWVTCFRKTRQDRIDELMEEMWILLSDKEISVIAYEDVDMLLEWLSPKFQKAKYRKLHRHAFKELVREGRIRVSRG